MKELFIKRVTPTTSQVFIHRFDDTEEPVTNEMPHEKCIEYLYAHQRELQIFKVGYTSLRKNGRRRQFGRILAHDECIAKDFFKWRVKLADEPGVYQLCTGDWKTILTITKEKEK